MKRSWTKAVLQLGAVAVVGFVSAVPANATVIAATDFDGRTLTITTVANDTATNLNWSLNGVVDPGDMAAKNAGGNGQVIFDGTPTVQNIFAPGLNTGNGNTFWTTDVRLAPAAGVDVTLTDVTFNYWAISGSQVENVNRRSDFTATLFNPSAVSVGDVTVADVLGGTVAGRPLVTLTFPAPIALTEPGDYTLQIKGGDFTGTNETGNHTAIDNLSINGDVLVAPVPGGKPIAVNFVDGGNDLEQPWAFGIPLADWTQTNGSASGSVTVDGVTVTWQSSNTWRIGGIPPTGEDEVYRGYLDDGSGGPTITLSGLGDWLAANSFAYYDLTVIMASGDNTQNGLAGPVVEMLDDTLLETLDVVGTVSYNGGTSLVGTGLSGGYRLDEIRLDGWQRNQVGSQIRGSIAGLIIEGHVPEPATLSLLSLAACGLARYVRRRRKA